MPHPAGKAQPVRSRGPEASPKAPPGLWNGEPGVVEVPLHRGDLDGGPRAHGAPRAEPQGVELQFPWRAWEELSPPQCKRPQLRPPNRSCQQLGLEAGAAGWVPAGGSEASVGGPGGVPGAQWRGPSDGVALEEGVRKRAVRSGDFSGNHLDKDLQSTST